MINRRTLLTGAALAGLAGVAGCSRPAVDGALTIGLTYIPNVQFSAFYLGVAEGIFTKHGLDVKLRHHGQQEDVFGAVLAGQEDVVFASADEAMVAASQGRDLRTFATSYQRYPIAVIGDARVPGIDPQAGLEALKGHSLGIPGHYGSSYYAALAAIHEAGLTEDDVRLMDIGYTGVSALTAGKVDFIMGFVNNELVQLEASGASVSVQPISDDAQPRLVGPSLVTVGTRTSNDVLKALADAMLEAEKAVVADPEAALDATAKEVPALADRAQREAAGKVLAATTPLWERDGGVSVAVDGAAMGRMGEFLKSAGIIEAVPENSYVSLG